MKKILNLFAFLIFLTSCGQSNLSPADMVEKGIEEYNNANYFGAAEWFRKAAEYDYDEAQNNLGILYKYGTGVEKDLAMAAYWFTKAAQQGNEAAIKNLEHLHDFAGAVPADVAQNNIEAKKCLDKAAAQGNKDAKKELAELNGSLSANATNNSSKQEGVVSNSTMNNETKQGSDAVANKPLYESHYYYTGEMSSGGQISAFNPLPAENVKIYADHIQFGRNFLYRLNGTYQLNGNVYQKYEAVDAQGNTMPTKFLLRDGKSLCEVTQINILGLTTTTVSYINEGFPPQTSQSTPSGNYSPAQSISAQPQQHTARRTCGLCNGWGKWKIVYAPQYSTSKADYWCPQCGRYDYIHHHETCASCGGTGYAQ